MKHGTRDRRTGSGRLKSLARWFRSVDARCTLIITIAAILMVGIFAVTSVPVRYDLHVGSISRYTINASKDVIDEVTTDLRREAAANAVEPSYKPAEGANEQVLSDLAYIFEELRSVQQYGQTLRGEDETDESFQKHTFSDTELTYAGSLVTTVTLRNYQLTTLMRATPEAFESMVTTVTTAVRNTLDTTIREGQESQSIQNILQIVGYRVDTSLYQNIVSTVLRACIRPNMVIETEATNAARQQARDEVEPVVYLQGQNIVREGDLVTASQLEMLRALGMLEDDEFDISTSAGAVIMIVSALVMMTLLMRNFARETLHDPLRLSVLMVVLVLSLAIFAVSTKLIHNQLAPVLLAPILTTVLLGAPEGIAASFSSALLIGTVSLGNSSALTIAMVLQMVCAMVSGIITVEILRGRPQRIRVLVAGLVGGLVDVLLMVAIALMTSSDMAALQANVLWCFGSAVLCGVLAIGIQPLVEVAFNLATPSKLLELANPNQPLLRRLLIEASGTYHHSIIVANLAEAAAEKIGANPLLARTGAYFHDIGKLKRPMYFKENQIGDNPHDKADPYVSAAIVTAHTRDGLALAQKHHLPREIQKIIAEHHGDTPVMYFYHKACQLSDGKPVDIGDFRYDGPRPTIKESAIVMLADTVEAAVRSMPDPTPKDIEMRIEKLVRAKVEDGQLTDAPLTLHDIDNICEAFTTVLNGAFHERIEYPNVELPHRSMAETHAAEAGQTTAPAAEKKPEAPAVPAVEKKPEAPAAPVMEKKPEAPAAPAAEKKPETPAVPVVEKKPEAPAAPAAEKKPEAPAVPAEKKPEAPAVEPAPAEKAVKA